MKRVPSSTESPVLNTVFTSSPVITSSAVGLSRILFLCTDMHWVKTITNLSPFAVYYQVDSVIRSFFSDRWCAARNFFTSERWCFYYFVFALSANLINLGLGIFCRNQSFPFCAVYRCADFSQYFRTFPCFYKYIFKINGSNLGFFFGKFLYSAHFEVVFYQSWLQFLKLEISDIYLRF